MQERDKVARLVERLQEGIAALVTGEDWQRFMEIASRFHRYSVWNTIAILVQQPEATQVAGYTTWKRVGRQVRRGEKGIKILAPCTYPVHREDDEGEGDTPARVVRGFKVVHVFDVHQTEGAPLADVPAVLLDGDAPAALLDGLAAQIEAAGFSYRRGPMPSQHARANGLTVYGTRSVVVRDDLSHAQAAKTTAHELAHVLMHGPDAPEHTRERCEVEAESVAFIVCAACGLDSGGYTFPYVGRWSMGDLDLVRSTAERVMATARQVIESLPVADDSASIPAA
ncbi:MAG TPA: ArdC-like ssDNA-binding domain-containing protein [Acidimicrobiales bacterium]|nr:ArdC-like ssDNA-binding domain-containing protein [Acidimicrobiales bacterium]